MSSSKNNAPGFLILPLLLLISCGRSPEEHHPGHDHHHSSDYITSLKELEKFDAGNGEFVYQMEGEKYGMNSLSFAITETHPKGGPPVHYHDTEEAHVVLTGKVTYLIGDSIFTVAGPFIAKVPAGVDHTFINSGDSILNLIAVFPENTFGKYHEVGKNPLIKE
ncbi:MAG: cupin domain-containing protein [Owenweeksia sp.]